MLEVALKTKILLDDFISGQDSRNTITKKNIARRILSPTGCQLYMRDEIAEPRFAGRGPRNDEADMFVAKAKDYIKTTIYGVSGGLLLQSALIYASNVL